MNNAEIKLHRRRLTAALKSEIRHYERCLPKLANLDADVLSAGMEFFEDSESLALWLCSPARALGGKVPILAARTKAGRKQVASILRALEGGAYL